MKVSTHMPRNSWRNAPLAACVAVSALAGAAQAQSIHATDYALRIFDGQLEPGGVDPATNDVVYPVRVNSAIFGAEGFANFTNDPGINTAPGALVPDLGLGFDLLAPLRSWDGAGFSGIADVTLRVRDGLDFVETPTVEEEVPGFIFGFADGDAAAVVHSHVQFLLDFGNTTAIDGLWLMTWRIWSDDPGIAATDPMYVVFGQGSGEALIDEAVEWVQLNLVGSPCSPDVNGDGIVDNGDIGAFVGLFLAQDASADFNGDGIIDNGDIGSFVQAFLAGC